MYFKTALRSNLIQFVCVSVNKNVARKTICNQNIAFVLDAFSPKVVENDETAKIAL